jgi:hypothetical protein
MSSGSTVGVATGYGLDDRGTGVRVPVGPRLLTSPFRPDRLWGPPDLIYNGYSRLDSRLCQIFSEVVGLERGSLGLVNATVELFERKSSDFGLESLEYGSRDPLR